MTPRSNITWCCIQNSSGKGRAKLKLEYIHFYLLTSHGLPIILPHIQAENLLKFDPNCRFFSPCDFEIWLMTSENNREHLLYYIKHFASFQIHWWIQTEIRVRKRSIWVKIGDFLSHVTLKFDRWPWKTIGHLFYTTSSIVHHFKAMGEFKLEVKSGNPQFGSKSAIFLSHVTLKFDGWPWKTIGHLFYTTSSFLRHFKAIGEFKLELQSRNAQFGSKSAIFCPVWPWNLTDDLEKG